jgi:multicomponent Na+:H+ antiporter subunit C
MLDDITARFPFWMTSILLIVGLYGMIGKRNLVKKIIGMSIFQSAIIFFFISQSVKLGATIPIIEEEAGAVDPTLYANPLPHVLMLTAIVVSVSITGVALAFLVRIRQQFNSLDEKEILEQVQ